MSRYFEKLRLEWLAEVLHIYGYFNRTHLKKKFGISTPQASADIKKFMRVNKNVRYNTTAKRYECFGEKHG